MKWMIFWGIGSLLLSPVAFAIPPVILSAPEPDIAAYYPADSSTTVIYTVTNNVPQMLPLTVSGISGSVTRTTVAQDCENVLSPGPSTCNIGIAIAPAAAEIGSTVNQTLEVHYDGRLPLTSSISFEVVQALAYVTPFPGSDFINQCPLDNSDGLFSSCSTAYTSSTQAYEKLTFATVGGIHYAYATDQSGFVYQCTLNDTTGAFDACNATPQTPPSGWGPSDIDFATVGGVQYAYVTDLNNELIYQCFLNATGGFTSCSPLEVSVTINAAYAIDLASVGGVQYAYIGDAGVGGGASGQVIQCTVNNTNGSFDDNCSSIPENSPPSWVPYGIDFVTIGGVQYAYVADNGTTPGLGKVYRCTLHSDGSFNTCTSTPNPAPTPNWVPSDIAFAALNGTPYAYVPCYQGSNGGMYQCTLSSDGIFDVCTSILNPNDPSDAWTPLGIAFRF